MEQPSEKLDRPTLLERLSAFLTREPEDREELLDLLHGAFERKLLGTKALDDYVAALKRGTDPLDAFRDLVGEPLPQFEKEHLQYLKDLGK